MGGQLDNESFRKEFDRLFKTEKGVPSVSFALKGNSGASKVKVKFYQDDRHILVLKFKGFYTDGMGIHDYVLAQIRKRLAANPPKPQKDAGKSDDD